MTFDPVYSRAAEREFAEAVSWYAERDARVAKALVEAVESAVDLASRMPLSYACVHRDLRRVLVKGFDYAVLFRLTSARPDITVVAVMHTRRSVSRWRLREPKAEFAVKGERPAED